jgi:hypothetical protein
MKETLTLLIIGLNFILFCKDFKNKDCALIAGDAFVLGWCLYSLVFGILK